MKFQDIPEVPDSAVAAAAPCSPLPPIRTVEDFRASANEWKAAMRCSSATDDREEMELANEACILEERRMDEARHLFEFDEEGDLIGLANALALPHLPGKRP